MAVAAPLVSPADLVLEERPRRILVVSDLHLGEGIDARSGRWTPRENFFADEAFARMLDHFAPSPADPALLVLDGDIVDFLRVVEVPRGADDLAAWSALLAGFGIERSPGQLHASIAPKERRYGLRTDDFKSLWKLDRVARGHARFFAALGTWVERGGRIVFVKGNHDLEFHWPLIRRATRRIIAGKRTGIDVEREILFADRALLVGNVFVEHGHPFESTTRVVGRPLLAGGRELNLPLGAFVNRYIVNGLEDLEPHLDNVKPVQRLLWTIVRRHPLKSLTLLWRSAPFLRRAVRPHWLRDGLGFGLYFASLAIPVLTVALALLALLLPGLGPYLGRVPGDRLLALALAGLVAPWLVGALRDLLPRRRHEFGEDRFAHGTYLALRRVAFPSGSPVRYGVLGHTHRADAQRLDRDGEPPTYYLNAGTWAPMWSERRPDQRGRAVHSLVLFERAADGWYRHRCLEWRDDRGEAVEAVILKE